MRRREFPLNDVFNACVIFRLIDCVNSGMRLVIFKDIFMMIITSGKNLFTNGGSNIVLFLLLADGFWENHKFDSRFWSGLFSGCITDADTRACLDCVYGLRCCLVQFLFPSLKGFEGFHVFDHLLRLLLFASVRNYSWDHGQQTEKECACKKSDDNLINVVIYKA